MTKKHKFIDTLKSWLVTLGVASVFGLAALGVNATKTYEKASAYDYQDNGSLLSSVSEFDFNLFSNYCLEYGQVDGTFYRVSLQFTAINNDLTHSCIGISFDTDGNLLYFTGVNNDVDDDYVTYRLNSSNEVYIDEYTGWFYDGQSFTFKFLPSDTGYQQLLNYALSYNAPQSQGNFLTALTSFMQLLGGAIVQLAQPVANGVTEFARDLFIDNNHLSILGGVIGIFAGIALAVGITTKVYTWVTSLGN